jgi:TATA-binding protein-associated factor Taf7
MRSIFSVLAMLLVLVSTRAQVEEQPLDSVAEKLIIIAGDSIMQSSIALEEAYIFGRLKFSSYDDKLRYYILRRKTHKVYPYAKLAAERLVALNDSLKYIKKKRHRKRYTKKVQQYIEEEFSEELKKLTRTEGQILVKLIYRQTGTTAFDLVKELRSGWRAFWYNTTARLFKISIKEEFHPDQIEEDYLIEDILQRAFASGKLERQETVLDYNYDDLYNKWKRTDKKE